MINSSLKLARLAGTTLQNKNSSALARALAGSVLRQYEPFGASNKNKKITSLKIILEREIKIKKDGTLLGKKVR